jgi:hypothetical protein
MPTCWNRRRPNANRCMSAPWQEIPDSGWRAWFYAERIDLTRSLPMHPCHHEGSWAVGRYVNNSCARSISLADAVALVERVRESAVRGAREGLEALAATVPVPIATIAIRVWPQLPLLTSQSGRHCRDFVRPRHQIHSHFFRDRLRADFTTFAHHSNQVISCK